MQTLGWFAVQVYTGREKWVATALEERAYETLLLLYSSVHQWSDRKMRIDRAVFPGYVFCKLHLQWRAGILSTPGVLRIVGAGRMPLPLDEEEVSSLMRIANAEYPASPAINIGSGERVVIVGGALDGVTGNLIRHRTSLRVIVSVSLLQRAISLEVDTARLQKIDSSETSDLQLQASEAIVSEPPVPVKRFRPLSPSVASAGADPTAPLTYQDIVPRPRPRETHTS